MTPTHGSDTSRVIDLFAGRADAYLTDVPRPSMRECGPGQLHEAVANHLAGLDNIGLYCTDDHGSCRWGCVDIDSGSWDEALNVWAHLMDRGVEAWIETSKSKGYHIWVFTDPIDAAVTRTVLRHAVVSCGLPARTEINPKQTRLAGSQRVGNCVRIPYGMRYKATASDAEPRCCPVLTPEGERGPVPLDAFLDAVEAWLPDVTDAVLAAYDEADTALQAEQRRQEAIRAALARSRELSADLNPALAGTRQRCQRILRGMETVQMGERNDCAYVIARYLYGRGTSYLAACAAMQRAVSEQFAGGYEFMGEAQAILDRTYGMRL